MKINDIIPLAGYVLVDKFDVNEKTTKSGIVIKTNRPLEILRGRVVAVSAQRIIGNSVYPSQLEVGDMVFFELKGPNRIKIDDQDYYLVKEDDVLGVVKNGNSAINN